MKIVCIADVYINEMMMLDGVRPFLKEEDTVQTFFFGIPDKKMMFDTLRYIEQRKLDQVETPEGLEAACSDADLIVVHLCPVRRSLLLKAKRLKAVLSCRGGLENIEVDAASELGIIVSNNPAHNANAVAEFTVGMILCETRNIARSHVALKSGEWRKNYPNTEYTIRELCDMTVGIIGFGSIGRLVAEKLKPFGPRILVSDPFVEDAGEYQLVPKETLLAQSDIVTLHVRSNGSVIGPAEFALMKDHSYLINSARSYLVDRDALFAALDSGKLLGAALDVFETEPDIPAQYLKYDNLTLTSHRGGDTINSYKDAPAFAMKNWFSYQSGGELKFFVNKNAISI